ncbi:MAG: hypothetical protein WA151_17220, partial [Desulfatirhabdiaceae bacterium]
LMLPSEGENYIIGRQAVHGWICFNMLLYSFQDKDYGCVIVRGSPKKAYPLPAAFPKSLS